MEAVIDNMQRKGVITPYEFTEAELREEIRKAEKGPFYTLEEAESMFEQWKDARRKP